MTRITNLAMTAAVLSMLCGCTAPSSATATAASADLHQDEFCETNEISTPANCKPGQRVVFLPDRFGNEQLPVLFAAANCDLRYSVVLTNGGVTCIFLRMKTAESVQTEAPAAN